MTELTEQLRAGELYYVKKKNGEIVIRQAHLYSCLRTEKAMPFVDFEDNDVEKVIAPVPSYDEYLESESHCAVYSEVNKSLKKENAQLKELLKECMPYFNELVEKQLKLEYIPQVYELLTKINEVLK